jgi:hypothetical protein
MMRGPIASVALAFVFGAVALSVFAQAQAPRDPTVAPAQAEVGGEGQATAVAPTYAVIIQGGRPHLVVGTRLVSVGQKVGDARLERITETEIWFREDGQLRKEARFAGITRTVAEAPVTCDAQVAKPNAKMPKSPRAATTAAPCQGAQP